MEKLQEFWEHCDDAFAHIKIHKHLKSYDHITDFWENMFITELEKYTNLHNSTVLDYGIGGGFLGIYLHSRCKLKKYIGIDIAERQLKEAKHNLDKNNIPHDLILNSQEFDKLNSDLFISQAVIQHFPDKKYLDTFLENINVSGIPFIVLQIRHGAITEFSDGNYDNREEVCWKCKTNKEYILTIMDKYENVYAGDIASNKYQYLFFKLNNQ